MASNPETKRETKDKPHPFEQSPRKDNSALVCKLGNTAIKGASKDKPKK